MYVELGAYQHHVFMDWRFEADFDGRWKALHESLRGAGVPSLEAAWQDMFAAGMAGASAEQKPPAKRKAPAGAKRKTTGAAKPSAKNTGKDKPQAATSRIKKAAKKPAAAKKIKPKRPLKKAPASAPRKKPASVKPNPPGQARQGSTKTPPRKKPRSK